MPQIRKKTSKRGTTHQRSKIKKKVAESRRKAKKEAKKNPQWKSKHKKDPGIPNSFPFKEQILAEVAAQHRREHEEKQRRKEQKKGEKAAAAAGSQQEGREDQNELLAGFDGISSVPLRSSSMGDATTEGKAWNATGGEHGEGDEDDAPILINRKYANLRSVLDQADVVLHVLDARDPFACRSSHLEEYIRTKEGRKLVFVLNKIDTCPREVTETWASELRKHATTCLFRSASAFLPQAADSAQKRPSTKASKTDKLSLSDAVGTELLLSILANEAKKKDDGPLYVAIVGISNTGKSSLLNSLLHKSSSPIYKLTSSPPGPSITERPLETTIEHKKYKVVLVDTPALIWERVAGLAETEASRQRARDMLLRNKGRIDKAKDPITPVTDIVARANNEDLMLFYTLPAFLPGAVDSFFAALARAQGFVKRHGELDISSAARVVLRDWSTGRLPRYAQPASPAAAAPIPIAKGVDADNSASEKALQHALAEPDVLEEVALLRSADEAILNATAPTRKEMRRGRGIVRLVPGEVQVRKVVLDAPWDEDLDRNGEEEEAIARANGKEKLARLPGLGEGLFDVSSEDEGIEVEGEEDEDEDLASGDNEMDDKDDGEDGEDGEVIEEEEEGEEEDEEEEEEIRPPAPSPPLTRSKRRRELEKTTMPASKKVTFAPNPPKHNPMQKLTRGLLAKAPVKRRK